MAERHGEGELDRADRKQREVKRSNQAPPANTKSGQRPLDPVTFQKPHLLVHKALGGHPDIN